jgi:hypothetical protein
VFPSALGLPLKATTYMLGILAIGKV